MSPHGPRWTRVSVTSWLEVGRCPRPEVEQMGITVTSWFEAEVGRCPLAEVGPVGVSVTSWSVVDVGQCPLPEVGGDGHCCHLVV